jgi:hypothetical protein
LWKYRDGKILLDDDNPAVLADSLAQTMIHPEQPLPEAGLDDVEFLPSAFIEKTGMTALGYVRSNASAESS